MSENRQNPSGYRPDREDRGEVLELRPAMVERLFEEARASRWSVRLGQFAQVLERSAGKRFGGAGATEKEIDEYFGTLHLADLALACGCMHGSEAAWDFFVENYRGYLRAAAAAILRRAADSPEAQDLADSLFTDLFGTGQGRAAERSLFRYFHGRSSLKTWLRAILAQRHVDNLRAMRRFDSIENENGESKIEAAPGGPQRMPLDPHRERYIGLFQRALAAALAALALRDFARMRYYYVEQQTLAEIGRRMKEHESSVSRHLERVRGELRQRVEESLRRGVRSGSDSGAVIGLSEAEIALCIEYAAEDIPFDLEKLLKQRDGGSAGPKRPQP